MLATTQKMRQGKFVWKQIQNYANLCKNIVLISGLSIHNIWRLLKFRQFFPPVLADHSGYSIV